MSKLWQISSYSSFTSAFMTVEHTSIFRVNSTQAQIGTSTNTADKQSTPDAPPREHPSHFVCSTTLIVTHVTCAPAVTGASWRGIPRHHAHCTRRPAPPHIGNIPTDGAPVLTIAAKLGPEAASLPHTTYVAHTARGNEESTTMSIFDRFEHRPHLTRSIPRRPRRRIRPTGHRTRLLQRLLPPRPRHHRIHRRRLRTQRHPQGRRRKPARTRRPRHGLVRIPRTPHHRRRRRQVAPHRARHRHRARLRSRHRRQRLRRLTPPPRTAHHPHRGHRDRPGIHQRHLRRRPPHRRSDPARRQPNRHRTYQDPLLDTPRPERSLMK